MCVVVVGKSRRGGRRKEKKEKCRRKGKPGTAGEKKKAWETEAFSTV